LSCVRPLGSKSIEVDPENVNAISNINMKAQNMQICIC
jgi:hypothetical protein